MFNTEELLVKIKKSISEIFSQYAYLVTGDETYLIRYLYLPNQIIGLKCMVIR